MEAAAIAWRPLGRLLVEQGLLSDQELELALAKQQITGKRLGETIVECGFVSRPDLSNALAAQYGIELTAETGFGTGLRALIQRRHETDRGRPAPAPRAALHAVEDLVEEPEPAMVELPSAGEALLLAQLEEQWAKLAAAEERLAALITERDARRAQAERLAHRARQARFERSAELDDRQTALAGAEKLLAERDRDLLIAEELFAELVAERDRLRERAARFAQRAREARWENAAGSEGREAALAEVEVLRAERDRRRAQVVRFLGRLRRRDEERRGLGELADGYRERIEQLSEDVHERELELARRRAQAQRLAHRARQARSGESAGFEEHMAVLAETDSLLAERDRQLAVVVADRDRRRAQVARFVRRVRARDDAVSRGNDELRGLGEFTDALREQVERLSDDVRGCDAEIERLRRENARRRSQGARFATRLRELRRGPEETPAPDPASHLVFVQLSGGYSLVERDGPPPRRNARVELPDLYEGTLVVEGLRRSPLPGDPRPCVVVQRS